MNMHTTIIEKDKLKIGNKFLGNIDLSISHPPKNRYEAVLHMAPEKGKRVLDVGCGNGTVLYNLRNSFDELHGIELIPEQAEWAVKTLRACNKVFDIKVANIEEGLTYPNNYFDYVIMAGVIEHIFDVKKIISELVRVVVPKGTVCISTPNIAYIKRRLKLLAGHFPLTANEKYLIEEDGLIDGGHIHYLTFNDMEFLLKKYGTTKKIGFGRLFNLIKIWPQASASGICAGVIKNIE